MNSDNNQLAIQITKELFLAMLEHGGHGMLGTSHETPDQNMEILGDRFKVLSKKIAEAISPSAIDPQ